MLARADGNGIHPFLRLPPSSSLGRLYTIVTRALGMKLYGDEGKTMALTEYVENPVDQGINLVTSNDNTGFLDINWSKVKQFCVLAQEARNNFSQQASIAATLQTILEESLVGLIRMGLHHSQESNLCLAGGVH